MKHHQFRSLSYLIRYPQGYCADKQYPLLLFLHGAGTRGNDISMLQSNPFFTITDTYDEFPFLTIAPQCSSDTWFDCFETLIAFAEAMAFRPDIDPTRVYLIGASMGGYGTWQLAMSLPDLFAAIVPICGGGMYWNAGRLKNVPVWAFHGGQDDTVRVEESEKMVHAVQQAGGDAALTIYPENGHDAWSDTYKNPDVFTWMISHRKTV